MKKRWLWCFAFMPLLHCDSGLPSASLIEKLRVLGVQAEPPEVAPAETSQLRVLAVVPEVQSLDGAASQPLQALWLACRPQESATSQPCGVAPGTDVASAPNCDTAPNAPLCVIGSGLEQTYRPTADLLDTDGRGQVTLTVVVTDTAEGPAQCLRDIAANKGIPTNPDHCVVALKRLALSTDAVRNHNPTLESFVIRDENAVEQSLVLPDATVTAAPEKKAPAFTLAVLRSAESAEQKSDGKYEELLVSWFATAGKMNGGRSQFQVADCKVQSDCTDRAPMIDSSTEWKPPTAAVLPRMAQDNGRVRLYAVVRDDRGGMSWIEGSLTVR